MQTILTTIYFSCPHEDLQNLVYVRSLFFKEYVRSPFQTERLALALILVQSINFISDHDHPNPFSTKMCFTPPLHHQHCNAVPVRAHSPTHSSISLSSHDLIDDEYLKGNYGFAFITLINGK